MRSRTAWFKYRPSHPAEAGKHWARLNLANMLPLHAQARATSRRLPLLLRVESGTYCLTQEHRGEGPGTAALDASDRRPPQGHHTIATVPFTLRNLKEDLE